MKTKRGFTLLELLVAMGIMAVLVSLSILGFNSVQTSLRDTSRRQTLSAVNEAINAFWSNNGTYPDTTDIEFHKSYVKVGGTQVPLNGSAVASATGVTDATQTAYCYQVDAASKSTYKLGADLEASSTNKFELQLGLGYSDNDASTKCTTPVFALP